MSRKRVHGAWAIQGCCPHGRLVWLGFDTLGYMKQPDANEPCLCGRVEKKPGRRERRRWARKLREELGKL